eukprot:TRINITY_DN797_c0_g1_i2.p2 TRINITY_DN797_c0_g1~~TRINITY_DN797_c0_g1_i2.p2  ORF type:complete len:420 (-),score=95.37 TRINITY_DN797_c0_g1_i2:1402-2661(-)
MIHEVYHTYVSHESPTQVNLPSSIFKQITEEFEEFAGKVDSALKKQAEAPGDKKKIEDKKVDETDSKSTISKSQSLEGDGLMAAVGKRPQHKRDTSDITNSRGVSEDSIDSFHLHPNLNDGKVGIDDNPLNLSQAIHSENDFTDGNRKGTIRKHRRVRSSASAPESPVLPVPMAVSVATVPTSAPADDDAESKKGSIRHRRKKSGSNPSWGEFMAEQTYLNSQKSNDAALKNSGDALDHKESSENHSSQRQKSADLDPMLHRKKSTEVEATSIVALRKKSAELESTTARKKSNELNLLDLQELNRPMTDEEIADSKATAVKHKRSRSKNISIGKWEIGVSLSGINVEDKPKKKTRSRQSILRQYVIVTIFDKALQEIFELMRADAFQRFRNTPRYERLAARLRADSDQKQAMRDLKILA